MNYKEWVEKLRVVYKEIEYASRESEDWLEMAVQEIGTTMIHKKNDLDKVFTEFDQVYSQVPSILFFFSALSLYNLKTDHTSSALCHKDLDGELSYTEFDKGIKSLGLGHKYSKLQREKIARLINKKGTGSIDYREFIAAFKGLYVCLLFVCLFVVGS